MCACVRAGRRPSAEASQQDVRLTRSHRLLLYAPLGIILSGFLLVPALIGLLATLTDYAPNGPALDGVGLHNYQAILADRTFCAAVRNIALYTLAAVPLQLAIGFGLACVLRRPIRGRTALRILLLVPWLVSPIASGVMWHFLFGSETGFFAYAG